MRGLKLGDSMQVSDAQRSHASRVRGLKRAKMGVNHAYFYVARFARAWIETRDSKKVFFPGGVARFARAWIETKSFF